MALICFPHFRVVASGIKSVVSGPNPWLRFQNIEKGTNTLALSDTAKTTRVRDACLWLKE